MIGKRRHLQINQPRNGWPFHILVRRAFGRRISASCPSPRRMFLQACNIRSWKFLVAWFITECHSKGRILDPTFGFYPSVNAPIHVGQILRFPKPSMAPINRTEFQLETFINFVIDVIAAIQTQLGVRNRYKMYGHRHTLQSIALLPMLFGYILAEPGATGSEAQAWPAVVEVSS